MDLFSNGPSDNNTRSDSLDANIRTGDRDNTVATFQNPNVSNTRRPEENGKANECISNTHSCHENSPMSISNLVNDCARRPDIVDIESMEDQEDDNRSIVFNRSALELNCSEEKGCMSFISVMF